MLSTELGVSSGVSLISGTMDLAGLGLMEVLKIAGDPWVEATTLMIVVVVRWRARQARPITAGAARRSERRTFIVVNELKMVIEDEISY